MRLLMPGAQVESISVAGKQSIFQQVAESLYGYDIVFSQQLDGENFGPLRSAELALRVDRFILFPAFSFTGLQPDQIYFYGETGKSIQSPFGPYHSSIIASAFSLGLSVSRCKKLFNSYIFSILEFEEEFLKSREYIIKKGQEMGFFFGRYIDQWSQSRVFMHTINHPDVGVLATIARDAAAKAQLVPEHIPVPVLKHDSLGAQGMWPVYLEVGRKLGVPSRAEFWRRKPHNLKGPLEAMNVETMIQESYEIYKNLSAKIFDQKSVAVVRDRLKKELRL